MDLILLLCLIGIIVALTDIVTHMEDEQYLTWEEFIDEIKKERDEEDK